MDTTERSKAGTKNTERRPADLRGKLRMNNPKTTRAEGLRSKKASRDGRVPAKNTKTHLIISLLKRKSGATMSELVTATNWQRHSIRGFVCRLPERFGVRIKPFKRNGEPGYRISPTTTGRSTK
jgi:hypothetical protein